MCPGWAVRQRSVSDAMRAYVALEKSSLSTVYPCGEDVVIESAMVLARAFAVHDSWITRRDVRSDGDSR